MANIRQSDSSDPKSNAKKPKTKREKLGQVFTPQLIANEMVVHLLRNRMQEPVRILDPCVGPCTFPAAFLRQQLLSEDDHLTMLDIDEEMTGEATNWSTSSHRNSVVERCDYLQRASDVYDYAILNPPYIRQEWIDQKFQYIRQFNEQHRAKIPGTANLYVYFLVKVVRELKVGGRFACIVYDSWQSTKFGRWLADFLQRECVDHEYIAVSNQPFDGRLIDATIIYATRAAATDNKSTRPFLLTNRTSLVSDIPGFVPLSDLFSTARGLRLKQADFFLCGKEQSENFQATPFVKKIGKVVGFSVPFDHSEAALLMERGKPKAAVEAELLRRLKIAEKERESNVSILTWKSERPEHWMFHRKPPYAPVLFNYYIRHRPKHVYNATRAYADNFYGLNPRLALDHFACLAMLNSTIACAGILTYARNQGNGLAKIQLFEYRNVKVPDLRNWSSSELHLLAELGRHLSTSTNHHHQIITAIDALVFRVYDDNRLHPDTLGPTFAEIDRKARRPK